MFLLQRRLPYHLFHTTRGNHHLNTSQLPVGLHFTFPLIPGTDQSSTPVPPFTHMYKPHTDLLRSLDLPCCHFWAFYLCLLSCYLTLDCLLVILIVYCLPRLWLCLLDCDCLPPALSSCLVFNSVCALPTVLPCQCLTLYCLTILNKTANGSKLFWLFVTVLLFTESTQSVYLALSLPTLLLYFFFLLADSFIRKSN